jgi:hypothetical protein
MAEYAISSSLKKNKTPPQARQNEAIASVGGRDGMTESDGGETQRKK